MSTKNVNNYNWKTFRDIFGQLQTQEHNATKKQIVRLQLNEKKSKESQTRLISWYWKRKPTWRKDLITYNSHPWIMFFPFIWLVIFWSEGRGFAWNWTSMVKGLEEFWMRMDKGVGILKIRQFSRTSYIYHPFMKQI